MKYQINNFKISPMDINNLENIIKNKFHLNDCKYEIFYKRFLWS